MPAIVVYQPVDVDNRLAQLGWGRDALLEVVAAMVRGRNSCTENDPAGAGGWMAWKEGSRRMREVGIPNGLVREDLDGIPWTTDLKRKLRFAVQNMDDATGLTVGPDPQNRNRKGAGTERVISDGFGTLLDGLPDGTVVPLSRIEPQPGIFVPWLLCVFNDDDVVRAELSCPCSVEGGYFQFIERIVLIGADPGDLAKRIDHRDGGDDFDIPVSRK